MTTESDSTGKIRQTTTSGIINERSENDSTMKMNTFAEKGTETGVMMGTSMTSDEKGVRELKEFFGQRISGGFMRRDRYTMKYKGHDLDLNKTEYFQIRGHVESGDYDSAFKILDKLARREAMRKHVAAGGKTSTFGQPEKVEGGPETPPEAQPGESELLNKRIAGLASKNGLNPATVTAQLEGGIPTSITSDGVTIDTYNDLTDAEKEKVNTARRMRSEMQSGGKQTVDQNQTSQAPAAAPSGALGGNEGAGQTQQQAPPAPAGGNEGAGTPEKAPPAAGAAPAGGTDTGATGTPTTAPAPAAAPSGGTSGETAGAGTPAAETTPSTPATSAAPAEGMGGSPSGTGTPEATPPAPSTPPAPAATPETSSAGGDPIVVNTSSTKNNKGSVGGEKNNIAGQNLPMTAQNEKIQEYLARQTVNYQ
jgi:hypothetical protein